MPLRDDELRFSYHDKEEFAFALRGTLEFSIETPEGMRRESTGGWASKTQEPRR
jgi:hypothetical protein